MAGTARRSRCLDMIKRISVEPILFLSFLSMQTSSVIQQVGIYRVVCQQTYASRPDINCRHLANVTVDGAPAENAVQKRVAMWNMALGIVYLAPALVADILLGAYGDRKGRKINMMLGMAGLMVSLYPLVVVFTYPLHVPMYVLVIAHVITGFTGFISITMISAFAYLADTVLDPEAITIRMAIMTVVMNMGSIVGPVIAGATAEALTFSQGVVVCQAILAAAFFLCLKLTRQIPPVKLRQMLKENQEKERGNSAMDGHRMENLKSAPGTDGHLAVSISTTPGESTPNESPSAMVWHLLKETWRTYVKPRPGNGRLFLLVSGSVFFLNIISEMGIRVSIFAVYVQKAPLSWNQKTLGYYKSAQAAMLMTGTIFGILIFKKVLKFTDTFIIIIASVSHISETLLMAFTTKTWMAYTAAAAGSLSTLASPCIQSFLAKHVGPDEVGKAYTAFGIAANIGFLVSNVIYNPIYSATVSFLPGFVFLFASALLGVALVAVCWLHYEVNFKNQEPGTEFKKKVIKSIFSAHGRKVPVGTDKVTPVDASAPPGRM